jgi:alginate O-acetyltransferase complex protein AlgI
VRYAEVSEELKRRFYSWEQFGHGAESFMIGFSMKVIIADTLSPLVGAIFENLDNPSFADSWLGGIAYTLELYFDFAGYSLMAIGLARMIGFHFPDNFNRPYLAGSSQEFWMRWHMTLSRFLRDYLYFNIGGSRVNQLRTYCNLMIVMTLGGLWHGSSWNFVIWGVWHGIMMCLHRYWVKRPGYRPLPYWFANFLTMLITILGRIVFRADDFPSAFRLLKAMFGLSGLGGISEDLAWQITPDQLWFVVIAIAIVYLPLIRGDRHALLPPAAQPFSATRLGWLLATVGPPAGFLLAMVMLYSRAAVPFLYFQF